MGIFALDVAHFLSKGLKSGCVRDSWFPKHTVASAPHGLYLVQLQR
jgi:hypothetical protein